MADAKICKDSITPCPTGYGKIRGPKLAALVAIALSTTVVGSCDPLQGSGTGQPPDPAQYIQVHQADRTAIVSLIAGYPATDVQFNYNGYGDGALVLKVPVGWQVTVQCENRGTVPNSCAVVRDGSSTEPIQPGWSTPDPHQGLDPGASASFEFAPDQTGSFRIASLVDGHQASGLWLDLEVVGAGVPTLTAPGF